VSEQRIKGNGAKIWHAVSSRPKSCLKGRHLLLGKLLFGSRPRYFSTAFAQDSRFKVFRRKPAYAKKKDEEKPSENRAETVEFRDGWHFRSSWNTFSSSPA